MAYTCPDCLRTSYHPRDEEERYCGNCHEFKATNIHPHLSDFQLAVARALQMPEDAEYFALSAVVQHYLRTQSGWDSILLELLALFNATRLSRGGLNALVNVTKRAGAMTKVPRLIE